MYHSGTFVSVQINILPHLAIVWLNYKGLKHFQHIDAAYSRQLDYDAGILMKMKQTYNTL